MKVAMMLLLGTHNQYKAELITNVELQIFLKKEANYELLSKTMKIIGIKISYQIICNTYLRT